MVLKQINRIVLMLPVALMIVAWPRISTPAEGLDEAPVQVVEQAAASLAEKLQGRQEYFAKNRAELYALINEIMLPRFDIRYAGKLVLGKTHWLAATEEQRDRFIDVFYSFLVRTYAKGVLEFDQDKLVISPKVSYSKDGSKAMVRTEFIVDGGDNVQVNYAVRQKDQSWKIYDVRVDGVSYIQNYRSQFDAEISAQGIEAVIVRLEQEIQKAEGESAAETKSESPQAI
jgi:phospholipid transport system substrate-binding protein